MNLQDSDKFKINNQDLKEIFKNWTIYIITPVILMALDQLEKWQFDLNLLWALWWALWLDFLTKLLTNYKKKLEKYVEENKK